jgi:PKD repeat protein
MASLPVAAFTSAPTSGLSVAFTDQTVGTATGWAWDFGDGGSSTLQNPTHTYAASGQYTVCLTVTNGPCSDQFCTTLSVVVGLENAFAIPGLSVFPNPYQGTTHVQFSMTESAQVRLEAFDLSGKFVAQVFEGQLNAGPQTLHFSAADYGAAAGVYMLRLHVGDQQASLRVHELR